MTTDEETRLEVAAAEVIDEGERGGPPRTPVAVKSLLALLFGVVAVTSAVIAAVGPATEQQGSVAWPSASLPVRGPAPNGAPLLLSLRLPASFEFEARCEQFDEPGIILATSRHPVDTLGLIVRLDADRVVSVAVGPNELGSGALPASGRPGCRLRIEFDGPAWRVVWPDGDVQRGTSSAPSIAGLYSDFLEQGDASPPVKATLTTISQDSEPSSRQLAATIVATAAVCAVFVLLRSRRTRGARRFRSPDIVDVAVVAALSGGTLALGPQPDDGWIATIVGNQVHSGTYSSYFDHYNDSAAFGFVHQAVISAASRLSTHILVLRLPALLLGIAAWWLIRAILQSADDNPPTRLQLSTAAAAFCAGWLASNITVRPEPLVAFLVVAVAANAARLRLEWSPARAVVAVVLAAVAVSIHPAGLAAAAPLVFVVRPFRRQATGSDPLGSIVLLGTALFTSLSVFLLLSFADTDLAAARTAASEISTANTHSGGPLSEWHRYVDLVNTVGFGNPFRRVAVLVPLGGLIAFLGSRLGRRGRVRDGSNWIIYSYGVGLVALSFSPSKWPFHFGALSGLGAAALGLVVQGFRDHPNRRGVALSVLGVGAATGLALVQPRWLGTNDLTPLGGWTASDRPTLWFVMICGGVLVTVGLSSVVRRRSGKQAMLAVATTGPRTVLAAWSIAILLLHVTDGARYPGWTFQRHLVGAVPGRCGPADVLRVADPRSGQVLARANGDSARAGDVEFSPSAPSTEMKGIDVWEAPTGFPRNRVFSLPDYRVASSGEPAVLPTWMDRRAFTILTAEYRDAQGKELETRVLEYWPRSSWSGVLVPPPKDRAARTLRIRVRTAGDAARGSLRIGEPRQVEWRQLTSVMEASAQPVLQSPGLANILRCVPQPRIVRGVAEIPGLSIGTVGDFAIEALARSPFLMLNDAFVRVDLVVDGPPDLRRKMIVREYRDDRLRTFDLGE